MNELDEVRQRVDIVAFLGDYVTLKKAGRNFKANCPFHSEKTASFVVSPERQIWHCFGACNTGGDIFTFLMKVENIEFPEALEILAKKAGVKLARQYRVTGDQKLKEEILKANRYAGLYYHYLLTSHKTGEKAREYLENRKINRKIWETFLLGYAPQNWDSLLLFLRKKGFSDFILTKAGLAISARSGKLYDRFRGRLMFALKDHRENVVGFSGRKMPGSEGSDTEAKYINTAETPVYIKGNVLYGLDITKDAIRKAGEAIIVEGEFDLLSSFQSGVTNIVAIKGTALTINQVNLLKRFAETISLALDSDLAGDTAARRGIEIAENAGFNIKVVQTSLGKDPDECVRENPALWKKAVLESIPVYDFLLQSALKRHNKNDAYGKKKIVDEIAPFYAKIENSIVKAHYISLLGKTINTDSNRIDEIIDKVKKGKPGFFKMPVSKVNEKKRDLIVEEYLLALFLQMPKIIYIQEVLTPDDSAKIVEAVENPAIKKIISLFFGWIGKLKEETPQTAVFIKTLNQELIPLADKAYLYELISVIGDTELYRNELLRTTRDLLRLFRRRRFQLLSTKIKENKSDEITQSLNEELKKLQEELKKLDSVRN